MTSTAPNIGRNYPSAGEIIGPGWQTMWDMMENGKWRRPTEFLENSDLKLAQSTIYTLLSKAEKAGLLSKRTTKVNGKITVHYRRRMWSAK